MRKALYVVLVLAGVLSGTIAAPMRPIPTKFHNHVVVDGLYVVLPTEMKSFPADLVAEP